MNITILVIGIIIGLLVGSILTYRAVLGVVKVLSPEKVDRVAKKFKSDFKRDKITFHSPSKKEGPLEGLEDEDFEAEKSTGTTKDIKGGQVDL